MFGLLFGRFFRLLGNCFLRAVILKSYFITRRKIWGPLLTFPLTPRGELHPEGWTWPQGGVIFPLGECSPLHSPPVVNTLYCLEEWRGKQRISPPRDKVHPWGVNFAPRGEIKNWPLCISFFKKTVWATFFTNSASHRAPATVKQKPWKHLFQKRSPLQGCQMA
jgi:hypothetical protein